MILQTLQAKDTKKFNAVDKATVVARIFVNSPKIIVYLWIAAVNAGSFFDSCKMGSDSTVVARRFIDFLPMLGYTLYALREMIRETFYDDNFLEASFDSTMHERQEKMKSTSLQSPNSADEAVACAPCPPFKFSRGDCAQADGTANSEILTSFIEEKAVFTEVLNLLEGYIQCPSEETSKPLKLLFDRGKSTYDKPLTAEKIDNILETLRKVLTKKCFANADSDIIKSEFPDHNRTNLGNKSMEFDQNLSYNDSGPNSLNSNNSVEDFQACLENEFEGEVHEIFESVGPSSDKKQVIENPKRKLSCGDSNTVHGVSSQIINLRKKRNATEGSIKELKKEKALLKRQLQVQRELSESLNDRLNELDENEFENDGTDGENYKLESNSCQSKVHKEFESIVRPSDKKQVIEKPKRKLFCEDSRMTNDVSSQIDNLRKQRNIIEGDVHKLESEKSVLKRQLQKQKELLETPNDIVKELEAENESLKVQLKSLRIEYRETLAELGQITVEQTAKENEEKGSKHFQRTFRSPKPKAKQPVRSSCNNKPTTEDNRLGYPNDNLTSSPNGSSNVSSDSSSNGSSSGSSNDSSSGLSSGSSHISSSNNSSKSDKSNRSENVKTPPVNVTGNVSVVDTAALSQQAIQGAAALVQSSNHQPGKEKEKMVTSDQGENKFQVRNHASTVVSTDISTVMDETTSRSLEKEKSSGGEGDNQSENGKEVKGTSDLGSTSIDESKNQSSTRRSYENLSYPVEQDDSNGREYISLRNVPPTSVATTLYNNYKLLLLILAERLLSSEVFKLKDWASQNFSIDNSPNAIDVLFKLDEKGVINASDLSQLSDFFESIFRIDLVCIIDAFLLGDYSLLWQTQTPRKREAEANRAENSQRRALSGYPGFLRPANTTSRSSQGPPNTLTTQTFARARCNSPPTTTFQASADRNLTSSRRADDNNESQSPVPQLTHKAISPNFSVHPNITNSKLLARSPNETQSTGHYGQPILNPTPIGFTAAPKAVVSDGPVTGERKTTSSKISTRTNPAAINQGRNTQPIGSNGFKHSKFGRPETEQGNVSNPQSPGGSRNQVTSGDQEGNWLCSHYKRRCYVKFECCDKFWPCHRCHNNQSSCGRKKLKSRDTKMLKCVNCDKVQQFGQFCSDCNTKFSNYYCGLCKHLTGTDDHPYHCEKCGICRIHGDRSFHCDICGVCLDVQLRGNHKCREGSAHDECCICLEDAFTGCQILPCSHKVHKDCATQMIRSGITRCPICRESFAHKLERRPAPNLRKRSGK